MRLQSSLLASTMLAASIAAAPAHAEEAARPTDVEELVVTAQRREQKLQEVPVAVSVFTAERRDRMGVNTVADIANFTPGLSYTTQGDRTTLRGVGRLTNVHSADGPVAIYNDGIYISSTVLAGAKTPMFIDRVEVLRGPQGTLYGRNAIAGAINIVSKRPTDTMYGELRASYANYNRTTIEAALSGPTAIKGINFRLAANWDKQTEGWYHNIVPGVPDEGNVIDTKIVEAQLQFKPQARFEGWVSLSALRWDNGGGGPASRQTWAPSPYPTYEYGVPAQTLTAGYGCNPNTTQVVNKSPLGCVNPQLTDPWTIASTVANKVKLTDTLLFASEWIYHFDGMDLKYIAGATRYHFSLRSPQETAPITQYVLPGGAKVFPTNAYNYAEIEKWYSHELNLSSTGDGALQWLAGLYAFHEHYRQPSSADVVTQPQLSAPLGLPSVFCPRTGGVCAPPNAGRYFEDIPDIEIDTKAIYGQVDYRFADTWKLTLGLRYSEDRKSGTEQGRLLCYLVTSCTNVLPELNALFPGGAIPAVDITQNPAVLPYPAATALPKGVTSVTTVDPVTGFAKRSLDHTWSSTTGTAALQWEPSDDTLVYARYSRGFKAGGYRLGVDVALASSPYTEAETVDAFEIGLKKDFRTLQANLSVFRDDYANAQAPLSVIATGGGIVQSQSIFYNVPESVAQGLELEAIWRPVPRLQVLLNYGYLDTHVTRARGVVDPADPGALDPRAHPLIAMTSCFNTSYASSIVGAPQLSNTCATDIYTRVPDPAHPGKFLPFTGFQRPQDLSGQQLPNSPRNKVALNVEYRLDLAAGGSLTPSITYLWRDEQYGSLFNRAYTRSPSWDQVDLRLVWRLPGDKLRVTLWGKNVFDRLGYEGGAIASRRAGTIDNNPLLGQTPVNVVQGVASTYPVTPPRTFGLDLQYKFF